MVLYSDRFLLTWPGRHCRDDKTKGTKGKVSRISELEFSTYGNRQACTGTNVNSLMVLAHFTPD